MRFIVAVVLATAIFSTPASASAADDAIERAIRPSATIPFEPETLADLAIRETIFIGITNLFLRKYPDCMWMRFELRKYPGVAVITIRCLALGRDHM